MDPKPTPLYNSLRRKRREMLLQGKEPKELHIDPITLDILDKELSLIFHVDVARTIRVEGLLIVLEENERFEVC